MQPPGPETSLAKQRPWICTVQGLASRWKEQTISFPPSLARSTRSRCWTRPFLTDGRTSLLRDLVPDVGPLLLCTRPNPDQLLSTGAGQRFGRRTPRLWASHQAVVATSYPIPNANAPPKMVVTKTALRLMKVL